MVASLAEKLLDELIVPVGVLTATVGVSFFFLKDFVVAIMSAV